MEVLGGGESILTPIRALLLGLVIGVEDVVKLSGQPNSVPSSLPSEHWGIPSQAL